MCYYRRFVPNFSSSAEPLNRLLKKGAPFNWGEEQQATLDHLKTVLTTEGLALKRVDSSKPLLLYTEGSQRGIGAVLAQAGDDGSGSRCWCHWYSMLFSAVVSRYTRAAATLDMSAAYVQQSMDSGPCLRQGLVLRTTHARAMPLISIYMADAKLHDHVCVVLLLHTTHFVLHSAKVCF
jgi:hypothetical protein